MSYKELLNLIQRLALSHPQINQVVWNEYNLSARTDLKYPVLLVYHTGSELTNILNTHSFQFVYADLLTKDELNIIDIQSTGFQVIPELINRLRNTDKYSDYDPITLNSFKQNYGDLLAGVSAEIELSTVSELGDCSWDCPIEEDCCDNINPTI